MKNFPLSVFVAGAAQGVEVYTLAEIRMEAW